MYKVTITNLFFIPVLGKKERQVRQLTEPGSAASVSG